MGVDYAIVHDETREAYELVRSNWESWEKALPSNIEAVRARVVAMYPDSPPAPAWVERATAEIWAFIQAHPGCRVENDLGNAYWTEEPEDPTEYRQVGSMYEPVTQRQGKENG